MGDVGGRRAGVLAAHPLLERSQEHALIEDAIETARGGTGALVLFEGGHGVGKTSLLSAVRGRAHERGLAVLHARAGEREREFAFGIARQLLEPCLAAVGDEEREALLAGPAGTVAPLLGYESSAGGADPDAYETLHGLYRLCANVAGERPLLVSIDDVHWADGPSLRFVDYLFGRLEQLPVLVALASDASEPGAGSDVLAAIAASPLAHVVRPAALSRSAVTDIVREELGEAAAGALAELCHESTAGNPFLLRELLGEISARDGTGAPLARDLVRRIGPATIASAVLRRLDRLAPHAVALARAVAVLGEGVQLSAAAALADLDEQTAADTAGALVDADVLAPGVPLGFVRPVVRAAIYEDIRTADRARGHGHAARLLAADGAPVDEVAGHLVCTQPGSDPWVVETLAEAARRALAGGTPDAAAAYLRRALAEPAPRDRAELSADLGRAELRLSHPGAAADHLSSALDEIADPDRRAAIGLDLGRALMMAGRCHDAIGRLDRLIAELKDGGGASPPRLEAELLAATRLNGRNRTLTADRLSQARWAAASEAPSRRVLLANVAFDAAVQGQDARNAAALARKALAGGVLLEHEGSESLHPYLAVWALVLSDGVEQADEALRAALASARLHGSRLGFAAASCFRSATLARRGLLAEAHDAGRNALDAARDGWRIGLPLAAAFQAEVLLERDELAAAAQLIDEAGVARAIPGSAGAGLALYGRGRVRIAMGQLEQGLDDLLQCGPTEPAQPMRGVAAGAWHSETALALARLDRLDEAARTAQEGLEAARAFGAPRAIATAQRTAGLIARGDRGPELIAQAAHLLRRSSERLELARTLVDLGAALRRRKQRSAARTELRAGLELAERFGAVALVKRAHTELQATGTRPRSPLRTGVDGLTPSERRVAEMAARGLTNREIAQELFVTVKTVEWHLGQVYRKLDVRRRDLPAALDLGGDRDPGDDAGVDARVAPDAKGPPAHLP